MEKMTAKDLILTGKTVLGIELGSTRIKGVLLDENHEMLAHSRRLRENQASGFLQIRLLSGRS